MGIFDFAKSAGAKIGLGDGPDDDEAKKQANAAKKELDEARAKSKAAREARVKERAQDRKAAMAKKSREEKVAERKKARSARADNVKRFASLQKARGLEKFVTDMGIEVKDLDVRFHEGLATVTGSVADQATREKVIMAIGNVEGVEQVHDEIEIPDDAADESATHVVASGDTLWKIAETQYGDGNRYPEIFEANKPMLSDPDKIYPGQVLRIPL